LGIARLYAAAAPSHAVNWRAMPGPAEVIPQSAAIPLRTDPASGRLQVLLIRRYDRGDWGIPKGHIDPDQTPAEAAAMEAREEAGVEGELSPQPLGSFTDEKASRGTCLVQVYTMRVTAEHPRWKEQAKRQRRWFDAEEAAATVGRPAVGELIRRAARGR
jgi:8-oxo-dGTP pyrophosphatase MutT (NUDIX family)